MRIAIIVEYLHARGGTRRQALELARHLVGRKHEITLFTKLFNRNACFPELNQGLNIIALHELKDIIKPNKSHFLARPSIRTGILRTSYDLVGLKYLMDYRKILQATHGLIALVESHARSGGFDILNPHDFGAAAWASNALSVTLQIPTVWQCNDPRSDGT